MTDNSVLTDEERKLVAEALAMLPAGPWTVASSNSFRRINGPDSKDGGVLHAYAQRGDGHPDLSMSEQVLWALCRVVNAAPGLLDAFADARRQIADLEYQLNSERVEAGELQRLAGQIAERDEALNEAADALEDGAHELERAHSQTFARAPMTFGELREEILRVADTMKTIATHRVRALLSKGSEEIGANALSSKDCSPETAAEEIGQPAVSATAALAGALTVLDQLSDALFELQERAEGWSVSGVYFTEPCFSENVAAIAKADAAEHARAEFYRTVQPRALAAAEPAVGEKS